jgi:hypothetical protein
MKSPTAVIDISPRLRERVSFQKFIRLARDHRGDIKSAEIELPRLGSKGFGSVIVEYVRPHYESNLKRRVK